MTNLTILNVILRVLGDTHEKTLTIALLTVQVLAISIIFPRTYLLKDVAPPN